MRRPNASFNVEDRYWYKVKELEHGTLFQQLFKNQAYAIFEEAKRVEGPSNATFLCNKHPRARFEIELHIIDKNIGTAALEDGAQEETEEMAKEPNVQRRAKEKEKWGRIRMMKQHAITREKGKGVPEKEKGEEKSG